MTSPAVLDHDGVRHGKGCPSAVLPEDAGNRHEKVCEAMVQILTGYYEQKDVIAKVVDSLLEISPNAVVQGESEPSGLKPSGQDVAAQEIRLEDIAKKITEGFYDRPEMVEAVATRLLE